MGKFKETPELAEHARRFLELPATSAGDSSFKLALQPLIPFIDYKLKGVFWRNYKDPQCFLDFKQEFYQKLIKNKPTGTRGLDDPVRTLKGWINKTGANIIKDHLRAASRYEIFSLNSDPECEGVDDKDTRREDCNGYIKNGVSIYNKQLQRFLHLLERRSPSLYKYFTVWLSNRKLDRHELALFLNTTPENLDQMRHRLRQFIEEYRIKHKG